MHKEWLETRNTVGTTLEVSASSDCMIFEEINDSLDEGDCARKVVIQVLENILDGVGVSNGSDLEVESTGPGSVPGLVTSTPKRRRYSRSGRTRRSRKRRKVLSEKELLNGNDDFEDVSLSEAYHVSSSFLNSSDGSGEGGDIRTEYFDVSASGGGALFTIDDFPVLTRNQAFWDNINDEVEDLGNGLVLGNGFIGAFQRRNGRWIKRGVKKKGIWTLEDIDILKNWRRTRGYRGMGYLRRSESHILFQK